MQVTLVSHYGPKSGKVLELVRVCQRTLSEALGAAFDPYELEQVHGTIIGLEGTRAGGNIKNRNSEKLALADCDVDPDTLLQFLRTNLALLNIRVGGFRPEVNWGFTSQGRHPYSRSFSIQQEIAVAMGWPVEAGTFPLTLDTLRRSFNSLNVVHKWHKQPADVDNDFFFVLGRVERSSISETQVRAVEEEIRVLLASLKDTIFPVDRDTLSIVGYVDAQLPTATSLAFAINDPELDATRLLDLYSV